MTYVTFVLMSKKQVATPLLSAKPSVSVPEVSTSDSKCALRKSVVSARNNNPRWEVRGWVVRDNKLRAKQCNKFVDFVIFVWDKNKPRWMKTFKAHTKCTEITKRRVAPPSLPSRCRHSAKPTHASLRCVNQCHPLTLIIHHDECFI